MRILIFLFFIFNSYAIELNVPKNNLKINIKSHHSSSWLTLFQQNSNWICSTNDNPYSHIKSNPISKELNEIFKSKKFNQNQHCKNKVVITNLLEGDLKVLKGCQSNPQISNFIESIYKSCKNNLVKI